MPFDLNLDQAQSLLTRISNVFSPATTDQIMLYAGQRVGVAAEQAIKEDMYPPPSGRALPLFYTRQRADGSTYQSKFKSEKQQRYVMMLAKKGLIPRKRTGLLGNSITSAATIIANGVVWVRVGSNLVYAGVVMDEDQQSHYFVGVWTPIQISIQSALPTLNKVAISAVVQEVNRRIRK